MGKLSGEFVFPSSFGIFIRNGSQCKRFPVLHLLIFYKTVIIQENEDFSSKIDGVNKKFQRSFFCQVTLFIRNHMNTDIQLRYSKIQWVKSLLRKIFGTCTFTSVLVCVPLPISTPTPMSIFVSIHYVCIYIFAIRPWHHTDIVLLHPQAAELHLVRGGQLTHSLCLVTGCITQLHEIRVKILVPTSHVVTLWPWIMDLRDLNRVAMVMCSSQSSLHTLLILDHIPAAGGPALYMHWAHTTHSRCVGPYSHFAAQPLLLLHTDTHTLTHSSYSI